MSVITPLLVPSCMMATPINGSLPSSAMTLPLTVKLWAKSNWNAITTRETNKRITLFISDF